MLRLKLIGTRSNRDAIGARVTLITSSGAHLDAMVKSGSSYFSQSEFPLTFGLGSPGSTKIAKIEIHWPSGLKQSIDNVEADQYVVVQEGKGIVSARPIIF